MYAVDGSDEVVERRDLPLPDPGAPEPLVVANERRVVLEYRVRGLGPGQIGAGGRMILPEDIPDGYDPVAFVEFDRARAHFLGSPNDEAIAGHPLAARGLRPYGIYEIRNSSWIRLLEKMNHVHPMHSPGRFSRLQHFVFTFHDSTFECVAEGVRSKELNRTDPEFLQAMLGFFGDTRRDR